jgi:hypothetical protein
LQFGDPVKVEKLVRELVAAVGLDMMAVGSASEGVEDKGILFFG